MGNKKAIYFFATILFSIALLSGMGCTKKITTSDNIISSPEKEPHSMASKEVEELVIIQEPSISVETISTNEKASDSNKPVIRLEDIFFDFDKDMLRPDSFTSLNRNIELLKANPAIQITIAGHTDERGTNEYNLTLSERRSRTARKYLVARGIAPERIRTIAYGEERPFCFEQTEDCHQLNRRAHFDTSD